MLDIRVFLLSLYFGAYRHLGDASRLQIPSLYNWDSAEISVFQWTPKIYHSLRVDDLAEINKINFVEEPLDFQWKFLSVKIGADLQWTQAWGLHATKYIDHATPILPLLPPPVLVSMKSNISKKYMRKHYEIMTRPIIASQSRSRHHRNIHKIIGDVLSCSVDKQSYSWWVLLGCALFLTFGRWCFLLLRRCYRLCSINGGSLFQKRTNQLFIEVMLAIILTLGHSVEGLEEENDHLFLQSQAVDPLEWQVGISLRDVVKEKAGDCNLFLVSTDQSPRLFSPLLRWTDDEARSVITTILKAKTNSGKETKPQEFKVPPILRSVIKMSSCWAMVLDLTVNGKGILDFMEVSQMFYFPKMPIIALGSHREVEKLLVGHRALRNSMYVTFLALGEVATSELLQSLRRKGGENAEKLTPFRILKSPELSESLKVLSRCLYCNDSDAGVRFLKSWKINDGSPENLTFPELPNELENLRGHQQNAVSMRRLPFIDFDKNWGGPEGTAGPLDSLDVRIVQTAANKSNFTFLIREPWDKKYGLPDKNGNFSGTVGTVQHEKADFSFMITPLPARMKVMDYSRVYTEDPFVIISLKPGPLPKSLAIVKPFGEWVWIGVIISCFTYGISYWFVEKILRLIYGGKKMDLTYSMFYVWRIILEDPPVKIPRYISSQVIIGSWWLVCFVFMSAYKSSLMSHLTVVKTHSAINAMEDLLTRNGYAFGRIPLSGASYLFLSENPSPVIRQVFRLMEVHPAEVQLDKVLAGGYSFVSRKYWALADLLKSEKEGLPVHKSSTEYPISSGYGWGFRKGAPVRLIVDKLKQRLIEAGLIAFWLEEIVNNIASKLGEEAKKDEKAGKRKKLQMEQEDKKMRVLSLEHVQGAFYLTAVGYLLAFFICIFEFARFYGWIPFCDA